jgi:hypothetical protein
MLLFSSYKNLHEIVDLLFPPMDSFSASETYSVYTYWREEPMIHSYEEEIREELEKIAKRQKSNKVNVKQKAISSTSTVTTPTTVQQPKTLPTPTIVSTPTATTMKSSGDKLLTIATVPDNNTTKRI